VLQAVRLTGALYFDVSAAAPWVVVTPAMQRIGTALMPDAEHVIPFHMVVSGAGWARPDDASLPPERVETGDVVMVPSGECHSMSSDRDRWDATAPDPSFYQAAAASDEPFTFVKLGRDGGAPTKIVCGYLGCDASPFNPVLGALPRLLVVRPRDGSETLMRELVRAALAENVRRRAGGATVLAKLSELMFVQAIRQHMDALPQTSASWLAGLRDEHVGKALQAIHECPAAPWSTATLAKRSGFSRSVFSERFARYTGEAPMHYVGRWRMQLAARLLAAGESIGAAAAEVGYQSDAAFQRAFKKLVGATPGEWRRKSKDAA
jgi:AraC-like DNA-binding protein